MLDVRLCVSLRQRDICIVSDKQHIFFNNIISSYFINDVRNSQCSLLSQIIWITARDLSLHCLIVACAIFDALFSHSASYEYCNDGSNDMIHLDVLVGNGTYGRTIKRHEQAELRVVAVINGQFLPRSATNMTSQIFE